MSGRPVARVVGVALVIGLVGAAGVVAVLDRDGDGGAPARSVGGQPTSSVRVARQDLVARTEFDGTLGYAGSLNVLGQVRGTVTAVPQVGTVVERGRPLYWVDNRPVPLLYGELPAWRRLAAGMTDGPDVKQLEENLVAMGHADVADLPGNGKFTAAVTEAVRRWQKTLAVEESGAVELGHAVFLPSAFRLAEPRVDRGASIQLGAPVLAGTSTKRVVQVDVDASRQSLARNGDKVDVKLPDGRVVAGTIGSVSTVAVTKGQGEAARRVVAVTVTLDDPGATGSVDQAPVRVGMTTESRKGVLAVPVNALLALAGGGYGVRVLDPTGPGRIVRVTPGLFARGAVEVVGEGLVEGAEVEVPVG